MDSPLDGEYICPICGKTYMTQGWLDRHMLTEHEGITFCENCKKVVPASLYCINCKEPLK